MPLVPNSELPASDTGCHGGAITTLATTIASPLELVGSLEALWSAPIAIPLKWLKLTRLFQSPAKRPGEMDRARYLARWYSTDQTDLAMAA